MALLHRASLRPTKIELLRAWAPTQAWFAGPAGSDPGELAVVGAYRFDDPAGEVGIETLLLRSGDGPVLQVPLTYRGAPLEGGEEHLVTTMEHSALGSRWVYDGVRDPVHVAAVATAALTGGPQAELFVEIDGVMVRRDPTMQARGVRDEGGHEGPGVSPPPVDALAVTEVDGITVIEAGDLRLVLARVASSDGLDVHLWPEASRRGAVVGTWDGQDDERVLALAALR